jgi:hypothetical protein
MGKEAALHLAQQSKQVEVVELPGGSEADQTANFINVIVLDDYLEEAGAEVHTELVLRNIVKDSVAVRGGDGKERTLSAEAVVLAPSLVPKTATADALSGIVDEVHVIGDCKAARILYNAIHEGFEAAISM